jgi:hypothetical protein
MHLAHAVGNVKSSYLQAPSSAFLRFVHAMFCKKAISQSVKCDRRVGRTE